MTEWHMFFRIQSDQLFETNNSLIGVTIELYLGDNW